MFVLSSKAAVFYEIKKGEYGSIVRNMRMISPYVKSFAGFSYTSILVYF